MILERLMFAVQPSAKDDWLKFEDEVWLPWLKLQDGFIEKQIQCSPGICVSNIWWRNKQCLNRAASKKQEIQAKDLELRRRFGTKVIRLNATS